jgi:PAS domain S-box-containing protein
MTTPTPDEPAGAGRPGSIGSTPDPTVADDGGSAPPQWFSKVPAISYVRRIKMSDPVRAGDTTHIGTEVERILGYGPAEFILDPDLWAAHIHPDDLARVLGTWRDTSEVGSRYHLAYRMVARDGRLVHVHDTAAVEEEPGSGIRSWCGIVVDVTADRQTAPTLREAEAKYRLLVEQIPAVTYIDEVPEDDPTDLTPAYISPQLERLLGYAPHEWLADPDLWNQVTHPDDVDAAEAGARRSFEDGTPLSIEYRMVARDGRTVWVREEASLYRDEHGAPKFWQGVYFDITDLKRAEDELQGALRREQQAAERLRAVDEMKNTFLQAVSHDLRTPLAAIHGLALTLAQEDIDLSDADVRDMANRIAANSHKLDRIVADLLDLDRLSRGIMEPKLTDTDVGPVVRELVAQLDIAKNRTVVLDVEPVMIPVDTSKLERIVENLLANSVRHTPAGTDIWIRTRSNEGGALIVVEDDGPGVPEELREAIFEPFRQGPSSSQHSPGAGVGLALVARFAELHRGRAWVEERPGGGASFHVWLPGRQVPQRRPGDRSVGG